MATNLKLAVATKNAMLDAITARIGANGLVNIYSGVQPASPDTAVGAQVLLATLAASAAFAPAAAGGILTANAIANGVGTAGAGTGTTATWFRITTSGGVAVVDGSVAAAGADMNINNTSIATGQTVSVSSATINAGN